VQSNISRIEDLRNDHNKDDFYWLEGRLVGIKRKLTKKGLEMMLGLFVERDASAWAELIVLPDVYKEHKKRLVVGAELRLKGKFLISWGSATLSVLEIEPVD